MRTANFYFDAANPEAACQIGVQLTELLLQSDKSLSNVIVLCIGTDRSTGDSLGPIVGYKLSCEAERIAFSNFSNRGITVYGTLDAPVHATNLEAILAKIKEYHKDSFCIAIDASLGCENHVGYVTVGNGPLRPGLGVNKQLPDVGDLHITGIVNVSGTNDPLLLQTTRLKTVMHLADTIAKGLLYCLDPQRLNLKPHISFLNPAKLTHGLRNGKGK